MKLILPCKQFYSVFYHGPLICERDVRPKIFELQGDVAFNSFCISKISFDLEFQSRDK